MTSASPPRAGAAGGPPSGAGAKPARGIRVAIVDDSTLIRQMLKDIFSSAEGFQVVGTAVNGKEGLALIEREQPDVVTLDVDMPVMDGYTTLKAIMNLGKKPAADAPRKIKIPSVVMVSGLTQEGARLTFKCLEAGAVDFVPKPIAQGQFALKNMAEEIIAKVRIAHRAGLMKRLRSATAAAKPATAASPIAKVGSSEIQLIAIGISTGGPKALADIFPSFPEDTPPIFIVQHMPSLFTKAFAERLNFGGKIRVSEAMDRQEVRAGEAVVAPGGKHLEVTRSGGKFLCRVIDSEKVNGHKPSASVLFHSVAPLGPRALGVIMTGMGADGLDGLEAMKKKGARVVAQDETSCVVYGMPKAAVDAGLADRIVPLDKIVPTIVNYCRKGRQE